MDGLTEIKKVKDNESVHMGGEDHYPWGTRLEFENEMIEALNLSECKVGDEVMIVAKAKVESRSEYERENASENTSQKSVSMQLTAIRITKEGDDKDRADKLYSGD